MRRSVFELIKMSWATQNYDSKICEIFRSWLMVKILKIIFHSRRSKLKQGPKLTFLYRRQVATENFFSVAKWKNLVAKKRFVKFLFHSEIRYKH